MYIIIAGAGIVGRNLTKQLVEKHDVVVIDVDEEVCERVYSEYGAVSIHGNATNINTLKEAGIEKADVAIGVMRNDADNLSFSLLAKDFGVEKIMVRMRDPEYKSAYQLAGATTIAGIVDMMVGEFVLDIEQPEVRKVVSLGGGKAEVSILTIPQGAWCHGKTISEITKADDFPKQVLIGGLFDQNKDDLVIPHGNAVVKESNRVFIVGTTQNIRQAADLLLKK
ncbi:K+ transport system, NAD-binding component [Halobacteroides halobius DSM 5150]|uniref:Trk system potassium uptake protein TrkA n=1 Tax=Halobacteroides halobius (strain ATCC 35273 / DSM 5150 / MD-1) TaxID=748449 RepID=L0KBC2_HALHC|nr:TrkA family potassium uptake protein [Halobacteroides halobius]AGB41830.1 K+ transport system, NAD-binding component [Halobacteroides halobius DSM 5150]